MHLAGRSQARSTMFRVRRIRLASFSAALEQLAEESAPRGAAEIGLDGKARFGLGRSYSPEVSLALGEMRPAGQRPARSSGMFRFYEAESGQPTGTQDAPCESENEPVAGSLRLHPAMTTDELCRLRRNLAMSCHPDRVPEPLRTQATQRMSLVNAQIDRALRNRSVP
jgi:hypothetical protein